LEVVKLGSSEQQGFTFHMSQCPGEGSIAENQTYFVLCDKD